MKKYIYKIGLLVLAFVFPIAAFAQKKDLNYIANLTTGYFKTAITLLISLAIVTFVWNVYRYFFTEKDKKEAGMYVLFSTVGFFVILSIWGLVALLTNTFRLENEQPAWPFGAGGGSRQNTYNASDDPIINNQNYTGTYNPWGSNSGGNRIPSASNSGNSIPSASNDGGDPIIDNVIR